ncbi:MAG: lasso peptide biosynthesis PqqD family chaperone [Verrucomicrobia bacterium]|jgi:hypothetical protein|nr:lasso peptide biosynthesis PqqD family chaperone [Verrucomicrobiota bacterium]
MRNDSKYVRDSGHVAATIDGDVVMLSVDKGEYFSTSGVGARIWEMMAEPISLSELAHALCNEYEVDEQKCLSDVQSFVQRLNELGLVHPVDSRD